MAQIIMYWDEIDPLGNPIAGIEILYSGVPTIEIPKDACGFRLEKPGGWDESWYFTEYGNNQIFVFQGVEWSSWGIGGPPSDVIEARGPVHGCADEEGSYTFQTPLAGALGFRGDDPIIAGAGSFVAEFFDESQITWLVDLPPEPPEPPDPVEPPEPPELPPEFFELPPSLVNCIQDFEGEWHCLEEDMAAVAQGFNFIAPGQGTPPPGIALFVAAGGGIIPQVKIIAPPVSNINTPSSSKVEVACPADLILTATFHKAPGFAPAEVHYRFRFAHGPISTVFSALVDGEVSVSHSVPIPLPPPIGPRSGGGGHPPSPGNIAVFVEPPEIPGGTPPHVLDEQNYQIEALPENEHKSSVRIEVINVIGGVVVSDWMTYHLVCTEASLRPALKMGLRGKGVPALQVGLNRWLKSQQMPLLKIDGIFGPRTETAVKAFQRANGLEVDGTVELKTWKELLSLRISY